MLGESYVQRCSFFAVSALKQRPDVCDVERLRAAPAPTTTTAFENYSVE
jgi:hypothetical protein